MVAQMRVVVREEARAMLGSNAMLGSIASRRDLDCDCDCDRDCHCNLDGSSLRICVTLNCEAASEYAHFFFDADPTHASHG